MRRVSGHGLQPGKAAPAAVPAAAARAPASSGTPRFLQPGQGGGTPLPAPVRRDFERGGIELSAVRVHADAQADAQARAHGALAFTQGEHIHFKAGRFDPHGADGRRLLAHELAHVLQQQRGAEGGAAACGDAHEQEADAQSARWLAGGTPQVTPAPAGRVQCQPDPAAQPVPAQQAGALKPPLYTSWFDEVVPGVLEAVEAEGALPLDRALWLVTQSYGEQSPLSVKPDGQVSHYLPSEHRNRLFNEHADVMPDPADKNRKIPVPGQEKEGVSIRTLPQNEFKDGKVVNAPSPTFGYDTAARSAAHHIELLKARRMSVYTTLQTGSSFTGFVERLAATKYATEPNYVAKLTAIEGQVRRQLTAWIRYRVPEMRERLDRMADYQAFLQDNLAGWRARQAGGEADPTGEIASQVAWYQGLVDGMAIQAAQVKADLARLERFAGAIRIKLPAAAAAP